MIQISLASTEFELVSKRTRNREFLDEMNLVSAEMNIDLLQGRRD